MKNIFLAICCAFSLALTAQEPKPTPSYNLLNYKIAELYKRAGDEHYIYNDLTQASPLAGNYDKEKELYQKAIYYAGLIDTTLLFADPGFRNYAFDIGLGPSSTFGLFKMELTYRFDLADKAEPFFVFDPLKTLQDFDTVLVSKMNFYFDQLKKLNDAIESKDKDFQQLSQVQSVFIQPNEADARSDIKIAEENRKYYEGEILYHETVMKRYDGVLGASIQHQKAIAQDIQKDLQDLDKLGEMNAGLLSQALSSYVGIPDINQVNNFIKNPNLKQAVDLALSSGGSKLAEELGKAASWSAEAMDAYNKIKKVYNTGKSYYEAATGVAKFLQDPNLDNFIETAKKVAGASGRDDLSRLAVQLEKGKKLWSSIKECAGKFSCACFDQALQAAAQSEEVKKYLDTLRQYNFSCESVSQLKNLVENPSFEALEALADNFGQLTNLLPDELKQLRNLKDSLLLLGRHSGFEKYIQMGELIAKKIPMAQFNEYKKEILGNKPLTLVYDLLLAKKDDYAAVIINNLVPDNGNASRKKLREFLTANIRDRNITPARFLKTLCLTWPEWVCTSFPSTTINALRQVVGAKDCESLVRSAANNEIVLREMAFVDSAIILRGRTIQYDVSTVVSRFVDNLVSKTSLDESLKPFLKEFIGHAFPSLRGSLNLPKANAPAVQANLFNALVQADTGKKLENELTLVHLGLYSTGKLGSDPAFVSAQNEQNNLDTIAYYSPAVEAAEQPNSQDMLKNLLIQGAVNYFAPGAMQAVQILSNLFKQGQIANNIREKNRQLQDLVRDYIDKSLDKDKYLLNVYRAEHEKNINTLIIKGKKTRLDQLEKAGYKFDFRKQLIKDQVGQYSSYYYYLLERLRETFTKYLWAYRKWYGGSYQDNVLNDPNNIRLILDPQIRYLTFYNYTDLGKRKGTAVIRQWEKVIDQVKYNHPDYMINKPDEEHLSPFSTYFENIAPDDWEKFKRWIVSDKPQDDYYRVKFPIDLLSPVSTGRWTLAMGDKLQRKLIGNDPDPLPTSFRLLGINVLFIDTTGALIEPGEMFSVFELKVDSATPSMINYGDRFMPEIYSHKSVNLGNFANLNRVVANRRIDYFNSLWGLPLQSTFDLHFRKNVHASTAAKARKRLREVRVVGFYFTNKQKDFTRSLGNISSLPLEINGVKYKIPFELNHIIRNSTDIETLKQRLNALQLKIKNP